MLRVIFFDLDETLVDQETAFEQAYQSTAEWLSREVIQVEPNVVSKKMPVAAEQALSASPLMGTIRRCRFGGRDHLWGNPGSGGGATPAITLHVEAFRKAAWDLLLEGYPVAGRFVGQCLTTELNRRFRAAMFAALHPFPDVGPTLERLARQYKLAVITNGLGAAQREKLAHLGIDGHFHAVIASAEIGVGKPAREIFEAAIQAMDVNAANALMIGDSIEGDIEGASSCGIRALWMNRHGNPISCEWPQISSLADWSPSISIPPSTRIGMKGR
jgi:putative hydrolase of the HAD superfamily